jgi:hypothetical protein
VTVLSPPSGWQPDDARDVARYQFLDHGISERGAERVADVLDRSIGETLATALADRAAALLSTWSGGVFALGAALAGLPQQVEPGPDVADLEPVEPFRSQPGYDIRREIISYPS